MSTEISSTDPSSTRFGRRQAAAVPTLSTDNESKDDTGSNTVQGGRRAGRTTDTLTAASTVNSDGKTMINNGPASGWGDTTTSGPVFTTTAQRMNVTNDSSSSSSTRHKFVQESVTEVVAVIRDNDTETMEDLASKVAVAPRNNTRRVQSLAELDNDTFSSLSSSAGTNNTNNSSSSSSSKSIDLSLLTAALCSPEVLVENDEVWEFDRLLQSLSQQMTADAEKKEGEDVSVTVGTVKKYLEKKN